MAGLGGRTAHSTAGSFVTRQAVARDENQIEQIDNGIPVDVRIGSAGQTGRAGTCLRQILWKEHGEVENVDERVAVQVAADQPVPTRGTRSDERGGVINAVGGRKIGGRASQRVEVVALP